MNTPPVPEPPSPPPTPTESPEVLPKMNEAAAQTTQSASKGSAKCKKKEWFALTLTLLDDKNKEQRLKGITVGLKIPDLGEVEKKANPGVNIGHLEPGGKGDVLYLKHDTNVYEASGDFS